MIGSRMYPKSEDRASPNPNDRSKPAYSGVRQILETGFMNSSEEGGYLMMKRDRSGTRLKRKTPIL
jgi:hypothetical protein